MALLQWLRGIAGPDVIAAWDQARRKAAMLKLPPPPPPKTSAPNVSGAKRVATTPRGGDAAEALAAVTEVERRVDLHDGVAYTRAEFVAEYGGTREWDMAKPANSGASGKPKNAKQGGGGGSGKHEVSSLADAVLVFLPGFKEIQTLHELLLGTREFGQEPHRSWVLPLHSLLPPEEQRRVFDRPPPGVRKVVLSTNIAETAVTVDDCGYVIDTGRMKEKRFDPQRRMESLDDVTVSRANAKQRRGRAGRCQPGVAFHLMTRHAHDAVCEAAQAPEIKRIPLERLVLTIKALGYVPPAAAVCAQLLDPPEPTAVQQAVRELAGMEAIDVKCAVEDRRASPAELSALARSVTTDDPAPPPRSPRLPSLLTPLSPPNCYAPASSAVWRWRGPHSARLPSRLPANRRAHRQVHPALRDLQCCRRGLDHRLHPRHTLALRRAV